MADGEPKLSVASVRVQNLRGFSEATLRLDERVLFLVGPNNSGKTSLLRLLDVALNWPLEREYVSVSDELLRVLLPAREARNAARRLTLWIRVSDRRRHSSLKCRDGLAELRLSLRVSDRRFRANIGPPKRNEVHDEKAAHLLEQLREEVEFVHIPAGRSVDSADFDGSLTRAMTASLINVLQKPGRGATKQERDAHKIVESLGKIADPVATFWSGFLGRLPAGWVAGGPMERGIDRAVLAQFIVEQTRLGLSTGAHDAAGVPPAEVGSGLQSLLDLEMRRFAAESSGRHLFLGIEEPEVFLHPSAQRRLSRRFTSVGGAHQLLISTHSPLVVEEAAYEQVAIVRDHVIHQPQTTDPQRHLINSSLVSGRGAEMFFARSVLLVEGPGDRQYWDAIRVRVAPYDESGSADHCFVVETGANTRFAPWLVLLRSYSPAPIRWIAAMDCDSASELRKCASLSGILLSARQDAGLREVKDRWQAGDLPSAEAAARGLAAFVAAEAQMLVIPGDLEHIMCSQLSSETISAITAATPAVASTRVELAAELGTKHRPGQRPREESLKSPWIRNVIGSLTPAKEFDPFVRDVIERWLTAAGGTESARRAWMSFARDG